MTDEEIIKLAEKTRKEKYCKLYYTDDICPCSESCSLLDIVDGLHCEKEIYKRAFVDGFKAAMNEIVKDATPRVCSIIFKDTE